MIQTRGVVVAASPLRYTQPMRLQPFRVILFLLLFGALSVACGEQAPQSTSGIGDGEAEPTVLASVVGGRSAVATVTTKPASQSPTTEVPFSVDAPATTDATATSAAEATLAAAPSQPPAPTATIIPTRTPTPDPYAGLSITALAQREYGGGQLEIVETLEHGDSITRYLITYPSDGLTIYGFMDVPNEGNNFPVALVLHGYVDPEAYDTVAYTARYAHSLAEAGYLVIHPNFRNYPPSDSGPDPFRTGYAIDVLNLIAIIREQSQDPLGYLRRADADHIHLWGHSMGGGVALRVITVNPGPHVRAAVLYGSMSGDESLNYARIRQWSEGESGAFELAAPAAILREISPIYHLERITAAVAIHHSNADQVVPPEWSADLCQRLQALEHPAECLTYDGLPHTFYGAGERLFMERVVDFFRRY
ncbi:MAG: alpha/beta fold hydrolase [Candidatus Promineifilaceae bacterium]|nr:alpha/beta fold hydrolase [Candidatus Promineifilaceae bacterium]